MNRLLIVVVGVVIAGTIAGFPVIGAAQSTPAGSGVVAVQAANASTGNVTPGEQLSGVIGVHEAEFEGELERRTFGIQIAKAATNDSKARTVKSQLDSTQQRLDELKAEKARLQEARDNGNISEGRYNAEMAQLAVRTETIKQLSNDTEAQAGQLPSDILERNGVNVAAIQQLRQEAKNLSGPEVAEIARSIAGRDVRGPPPGKAPGSVGPPSDAGPPSDVGPQRGGNASEAENASQEADEAISQAESRVQAARDRVAQARDRVNETNGSSEAVSALERAEAQLEQAVSALETARSARDAGNLEQAIEEANQAKSHADDASDAASDAQEKADSQQRSGSGQDGGDSTDDTSDQDEASDSDRGQGGNGSDNASDTTDRGG